LNCAWAPPAQTASPIDIAKRKRQVLRMDTPSLSIFQETNFAKMQIAGTNTPKAIDGGGKCE
jgi:hypothetical protein